LARDKWHAHCGRTMGLPRVGTRASISSSIRIIVIRIAVAVVVFIVVLFFV